MSEAQSALVIAVPHANALRALDDGIAMAEALRRHRWAVDLYAKRFCPENHRTRVSYDLYDLVVFSGEANPDLTLWLGDTAVDYREVAALGYACIFDCCYIGAELREAGSKQVWAASTALAYNRVGAGSVFMDALLSVDAATVGGILGDGGRKSEMDNWYAIVYRVAQWCRQNPTTEQTPVRGWLP